MSLGVVIKGPEGVVLASDSRVTLTAERPGIPPLHVNFDNATKLLSFSEPHNFVGAVTYGSAVIGLRTAHSYVPEFETTLEDRRLPVAEYAKELSEFFKKQWEQVLPPEYQGPTMVFVVGGYDEGDSYGKVFVFDIPTNPEPIEQNPGPTNFGMTWGGQLQVASRLIHGFDPAIPGILQEELNLTTEQLDRVRTLFQQRLEFTIPYQVLPLQDCVDLATFMIRTTINAQDLAISVRGVGGPIDVAVISKTRGLDHIRRKTLTVNDRRL